LDGTNGPILPSFHPVSFTLPLALESSELARHSLTYDFNPIQRKSLHTPERATQSLG